MGTIPTIPTFTAGQVLTAALVNQIKAANDFWALTPRCLAYQSTIQTFTTAVYSVISLDNEVYDIVQAGDSPSHDTVTTNSRIVVRTPGKYEVCGQLLFDVSATGSRSLQIRKNAAGAVAGGTQLVVSNNGAIATFATAVQVPVFEDTFVAGDYIEMFGYQNSGGNLASNIAGRATFLRMKLTGS